MKKYVAEYVTKCLTCQKIKAKHQGPCGELQPIKILEWKWDQIAMDFVVGFPKTTKSHDAIWVTMDRLTKSKHYTNQNDLFVGTNGGFVRSGDCLFTWCAEIYYI